MKIIDVERWVTYELIWVISVSTIWDIFNKLLGKQKLTPKPTVAGPNYGSPDQPTKSAGHGESAQVHLNVFKPLPGIGHFDICV